MIELSCEQERGAALFTRTHGIREAASRDDALQKYFLKNYASWYKHATKNLRYSLKLKDMLLVTSCVLTNDWATAIFKQTSQEAKVSFHLQPPFFKTGMGAWGKWQSNSSIPLRSGPGRSGRKWAPSATLQGLSPLDSDLLPRNAHNSLENPLPSLSKSSLPFSGTSIGSAVDDSNSEISAGSFHTAIEPIQGTGPDLSHLPQSLEELDEHNTPANEFDQCIFLSGFRIIKKLKVRPTVMALPSQAIWETEIPPHILIPELMGEKEMEFSKYSTVNMDNTSISPTSSEVDEDVEVEEVPSSADVCFCMS